MNKMIITEKGVSNKPVVIITFKTEASIVDYWIRNLEENPGKYDIEMILQFNYSEACAENFHAVYAGLLMAYKIKAGELTPDRILAAFFGTMTGFSYAEEKFNEEGEFNDSLE